MGVSSGSLRGGLLGRGCRCLAICRRLVECRTRRLGLTLVVLRVLVRVLLLLMKRATLLLTRLRLGDPLLLKRLRLALARGYGARFLFGGRFPRLSLLGWVRTVLRLLLG